MVGRTPQWRRPTSFGLLAGWAEQGRLWEDLGRLGEGRSAAGRGGMQLGNLDAICSRASWCVCLFELAPAKDLVEIQGDPIGGREAYKWISNNAFPFPSQPPNCPSTTACTVACFSTGDGGGKHRHIGL